MYPKYPVLDPPPLWVIWIKYPFLDFSKETIYLLSDFRILVKRAHPESRVSISQAGRGVHASLSHNLLGNVLVTFAI